MNRGFKYRTSIIPWNARVVPLLFFLLRCWRDGEKEKKNKITSSCERAVEKLVSARKFPIVYAISKMLRNTFRSKVKGNRSVLEVHPVGTNE